MPDQVRGEIGELWWKFTGGDYKTGQVVRLARYWPDQKMWSYDRPDAPGQTVFDIKRGSHYVSRGVGLGYDQWKLASEYDYSGAKQMYRLLLFDDSAEWAEITYDLKDDVRAVMGHSPGKVTFTNLGDPSDVYDTIDINLKQKRDLHGHRHRRGAARLL